MWSWAWAAAWAAWAADAAAGAGALSWQAPLLRLLQVLRCIVCPALPPAPPSCSNPTGCSGAVQARRARGRARRRPRPGPARRQAGRRRAARVFRPRCAAEQQGRAGLWGPVMGPPPALSGSPRPPAARSPRLFGFTMTPAAEQRVCTWRPCPRCSPLRARAPCKGAAGVHVVMPPPLAGPRARGRGTGPALPTVFHWLSACTPAQLTHPACISASAPRPVTALLSAVCAPGGWGAPSPSAVTAA